MIIINEMAVNKDIAMDRCQSLGFRFLEHFDKIYTEADNNTKHHHAKEMQSWFNSVMRIRLKNNKYLIKQQLIDWFFTAMGDPKDSFTSGDVELEEEIYDDFYFELLNSGSVLDALLKVNLIDNKLN